MRNDGSHATSFAAIKTASRGRLPTNMVEIPESHQECEGAVRYAAVLEASALEEGCTRAVVVGNQAIVLAKHGDRIYACENRCPHQGQELAGGLLRRGQLICRHHGARFDLATGASTGPHTECAIKIFPVRIVEGRVEVAVPVSAP